VKLKWLLVLCLFALPAHAQRNASLLIPKPALASPQVAAHSVLLSWTASTSANVIGYNVYRGSAPGNEIAITPPLVAGTSYTDGTVQAGQTYYYVVTAMNSSMITSVFSNEVKAVIPAGVTPPPPPPPTCATLAVGCRISVKTTANIRQAPTSSTTLPALYGTEPTGALGTVLAISPFGYAAFGVPNWLEIQYDTCVAAIPGCLGWQGSDNVVLVATPPPPPPPPPPSMTTTCAWLTDGVTWDCKTATANVPKAQAIKSAVTSGTLSNTTTGVHP
jgi:hypothetical protein